MRLGALITKGGNLVVVVVVVVTTVVCVAGAKENCPSVLSAPNCAMVETSRSLLCSLCSVAGGGNLEAKEGLIDSCGVVF
jgi:hypothetical protein